MIWGLLLAVWMISTLNFLIHVGASGQPHAPVSRTHAPYLCITPIAVGFKEEDLPDRSSKLDERKVRHSVLIIGLPNR